MAKKIFYFSFGFFVLVLIFWGAYNFAFKNNVNSPIADPSKKEFEKMKAPILLCCKAMHFPIRLMKISSVAPLMTLVISTIIPLMTKH